MVPTIGIESSLNLATMINAFCANTISKRSAALCRCKPTQSCWPNHKMWAALARQLTGRLVKPVSPLASCKKNAKSKACAKELKLVRNPFYLQSRPGASESQGWWKAWTYHNSEYAVEAENTKDIIAAVNFARKHNIKLVIKGAGHDYLGRSNAPYSLLIWTHHLQKLVHHKSFIPASAPTKTKGVSAMTVGAGVVWLQVYQKAARYHQFVLGGGCTSVGASGGFTLGGGFGSWSKKYGTGAANLLQVKIVMADGRVLTANAYQNQDLFWALRGAGFGLGVVTQMTYRTYPLPTYFGGVSGAIAAKDDASYKLLIKHLLVFLRDNIPNQHWGEQVRFYSNNKIGLSLASQGLNKKMEKAIWAPFVKWVKSHPKRFILQIQFYQIPAQDKWKYSSSNSSMILNRLPGAPKGQFWWSGDIGQVHAYWISYHSWWLPLHLFQKKSIDQLAETLFKASRHLPLFVNLALHLNKGLAGASADAIQRTRETSINPNLTHAAGLIITGFGLPPAIYFGVPQHLTKATLKDIAKLHLHKRDFLPKNIVSALNNAMYLIKSLSPNAGSYVNETDYFQPDWQQSFWGVHYPRLLKIKQKYDPNGLFYCHHCVGSEFWDKVGLCRIRKN